MTGDPGKLRCTEFQAKLPELIASGEDLAAITICRAASFAAPCSPTSKPSPRRHASCFP